MTQIFTVQFPILVLITKVHHSPRDLGQLPDREGGGPGEAARHHHHHPALHQPRLLGAGETVTATIDAGGLQIVNPTNLTAPNPPATAEVGGGHRVLVTMAGGARVTM